MANATKVWIWSEQLGSKSFGRGEWYEFWDTGNNYTYTRTTDGFQLNAYPYSNNPWVISRTEPDGPPDAPTGEKISFEWKMVPEFDVTVELSYRPQDVGDLMETLSESHPSSMKITCVKASGVNSHRCSNCEEYSNDGEHGLCRGCGHKEWVLWTEDKYEVGYTYTL